MWLKKTLSLLSALKKTVSQVPFIKRAFPTKYRTRIDEWLAVSEAVEFIRRIGFYDNFSYDSLGQYVLTQLNGYIAIDGGFLKSVPGAVGVVGYTRLAAKQEFTLNREHTVKSQFFLKSWHLYSDVAIGFSTEKTLGNIAYRGDLGLWLDYNVIKLFYRQTRGSTAYEVVLGSLSATPDDVITFSLTHNGNQTRCEVWKNTVKVLDETRTTFFYGTMYGVFGARDGIETTDTTNIWADYFAVYSDPDASSIISNPDIPRTAIIETERYRDAITKKTLTLTTWNKKTLTQPTWSKKNAP